MLGLQTRLALVATLMLIMLLMVLLPVGGVVGAYRLRGTHAIEVQEVAPAHSRLADGSIQHSPTPTEAAEGAN